MNQLASCGGLRSEKKWGQKKWKHVGAKTKKQKKFPALIILSLKSKPIAAIVSGLLLFLSSFAFRVLSHLLFDDNCRS